MKFSKLFIFMIAIGTIAACDSNHQAYQQPQTQPQYQQQAPVIVQAPQSNDNSLATGLVAGGLGYMLGKNSNSQPTQQLQPANKTVVNKTVNNYIVQNPQEQKVIVSRAAPPQVSQKPVVPQAVAKPAVPSFKQASSYKQSTPTVTYKSSSTSKK